MSTMTVISHEKENIIVPYLNGDVNGELEIDVITVSYSDLEDDEYDASECMKLPFIYDDYAGYLLKKQDSKNPITFVGVFNKDLMNSLEEENFVEITMYFVKQGLLDYCNEHNISVEPIICCYVTESDMNKKGFKEHSRTGTPEYEKEKAVESNILRRKCSVLESNGFINKEFSDFGFAETYIPFTLPTVRSLLERTIETVKTMSGGNSIKGSAFGIGELVTVLTEKETLTSREKM